MLKNNFFTLIIVAIILVLASFYLYGSNFKNFLSSGGLSSTPTTSPNIKTEEFTITGSNFKFTPSEITVTKGDKIKITFKDSDGPHSLTIPDFKTSTKTLSAGQQEAVEFIADKTGTFPFFCSYAHHKEFGMIGKIIVK